MNIQIGTGETYPSISKEKENILDGVLSQIFNKEIKSKEEPSIAIKIHNILVDIFGEEAHYVCRRLCKTNRTTDNLPAIGFYIKEDFNKNSFLNFLMRNMRTQQLAHPNYFSFYVKHENSNEMVHTFKIPIKPINSEISKEYEFPVFTKET